MTQLIANLETGEFSHQRTGHDLLDDVIAEHKPVALLALFSGGHDSLVNTHLTAQHPAFTAVVHINTGIGIPETTEYVRETCKRFGWPIIIAEAKAGAYERECMTIGMPKAPMHNFIYHKLKLNALERVVKQFKRERTDRILLSTGIRHAESVRRQKFYTSWRRDGAKIWTNPILNYSTEDISRYITLHDLPRNPVSDKLHISGECLCGAMANSDQIKEIEFWYPEVAARIHAIEQRCFERGLPSQWGSKREIIPDARQAFMPMCSSCELRWANEE